MSEQPVTSYPLCWPASWKRTGSGERLNGRFNIKELKSSFNSNTNTTRTYRQTKPVSIADAVGRVLETLNMLGAPPSGIIISTNIEPRLDGLPRSGKEPADPGVAVYWSTAKNPKQKCMAIDKYRSAADNLAAIAATLEAMRAIERHGGAEILERVFLGFQSLPPPVNGGRPWWYVLGFEYGGWHITLDEAEQRYRFLAQQRHPDKGGNADSMSRLNEAIRQARELLG